MYDQLQDQVNELKQHIALLKLQVESLIEDRNLHLNLTATIKEVEK